LKDFSTGKVQVLVNCMVLTEGYDQPDASCVVIARPTRSASLYVQMVGRVLRPFHGGGDPGRLERLGELAGGTDGGGEHQPLPVLGVLHVRFGDDPLSVVVQEKVGQG